MASGIRWTAEMLLEFQERTKQRQHSPLSPSLREKKADMLTPLTSIPQEEKKPSKYRNKKIVVDGIEFDSRKEARRWVELSRQQAAGLIAELRHQVPFELAPAVYLNGDAKKKPALRYFADFTYMRGDLFVVEDVKSAATRTKESYRIKRHLLLSVHGLQIDEI